MTNRDPNMGRIGTIQADNVTFKPEKTDETPKIPKSSQKPPKITTKDPDA